MNANQRKYPRVNYPCSITVWRQDGYSEVVMANTSNISAGGLCVYFNEAMTPGTPLEVKIDNFFEGNPLSCSGEVVRCRPDPNSQGSRNKYYEIGIKFLSINDRQREYLEGFVERLRNLDAKKKS